MKRTFTFLFAALLACVSMVKAQVTSLEGLSNDKAYTVSTKDRGSWYYAPEKKTLSSTTKENIAVDATDAKQQYAFLTVGDKVYLYSVAANKFVVKNGDYTAVVTYPEAHVTFEATSNSDYPVVVALNGANHIGVSNGYDPAVITSWNDVTDGGNQVNIVAVEGTFDFTEALARFDMGLAAERNALLAVVEIANTVYEAIEDKTQDAAVELKDQIDAALEQANAADATAEALVAQKTGLNAAQVSVLLGQYKSAQTFNLKNASTGLYMTIVETEGTNNNAGGLQIKALEEKNNNQMFRLVAADDKFKIKSSNGICLSAFSAWGYKATGTDSDDAAHEIVYVGDGKFTLKSTLGYVGSNAGAKDDGSPMYSNHGSGNPNIYWTLEPVEMSELAVVGVKVGDVALVEGAATVESISTIDVTFGCPVTLVENAGWATLEDSWEATPLKAEVLEDDNCVVRISAWSEFTFADNYLLNIPAGFIIGTEDIYYSNAEIEAMITIEEAPATPLAVTNVTVGEEVMADPTIAVATTEDMITINFDGEFYLQNPTIVDANSEDASMSFDYFPLSTTSYGLQGKKAGIYTITLPKESFLVMGVYKAPAEDIVLTVQITDDLTDGIENIEAETETVIYDLSGRRVEKMEKGIYIVNGKKVIK